MCAAIIVCVNDVYIDAGIFTMLLMLIDRKKPCLNVLNHTRMQRSVGITAVKAIEFITRDFIEHVHSEAYLIIRYHA